MPALLLPILIVGAIIYALFKLFVEPIILSDSPTVRIVGSIVLIILILAIVVALSH